MAMLCLSPSLKRKKIDNSQQVDDSSVDLSFLDDIDVDEIAECLSRCDGPSNFENRKSSTSTVNDYVDSIPCSGTSYNIGQPKSNQKYSKPCNDMEKLQQKLENRMHELFKEHYISSVIHNGKYSTIIKCKDTAFNTLAIKILKDKEQIYYGEAKEHMLLQMQMNISRDNLFCIYFWQGFYLGEHWCFMMQYYPKSLNQAMEELRKPFHINNVQELARQLVTAVTFLKYNDIVHSDIKPSHILLDSSNEKLRLGGFDGAYYIGAEKTSSHQGTINYRSPETILGYSSGFSIDVWSTAIVLLEMATGLVIFPGKTNNDILFKQMSMLGSIPDEMLAKSKYESQYFSGKMFLSKNSFMNTNISTFKRTNKLENMVFNRQSSHWLKDYESMYKKKGKKKIMKKICSFLEMIMQMVVLKPEDRISIDIAYSDPFIYEMFN